MTKVLIVSLVGFDYEGITSVIYNFSSNMNKNNLKLDFIIYTDTASEFIDKFSRIGELHTTVNRKRNFFKYLKDFNCVLKRGNYDVVHIHGNSGTMVIEALLAKIHKVKKIIVHAHNTKCNHPIINSILTPIMKAIATDFLACSDAAGKWLYKNSKYTVLNNAINTSRFRYNPTLRNECRKELGLTDEFLIGHIGNFFTDRKNQSFLVDVFAEVHRREPESRLVLIGNGQKMSEIKEKVSELGLSNEVIFTGGRNDTERLYCAMDVFVLPSILEGLPVAMLEAQASGLPCVISSAVTHEAKCTDNVVYKDLSDNAVSWAEEVIRMKGLNIIRVDAHNTIKDHGFDIAQEAVELKNLYVH